VVDAAVGVWGRERVGVRLSPYGTFNDMHDSDPVALFTHVLGRLSDRGIAYVHMIEPRATSAGGGDAVLEAAPCTAEIFRPLFDGVFISAGGYDREGALEAVASGRADAIAFGRAFIANPDLPERLRQDTPLNPYDRSTFYGGDARGYTDYPALG
jgi:N-ethylmaleimide reductase